MKKRPFKIMAGGLALALIGFLVVVSGVVPIAASSGHWPITRWFLHFSMQRSVSTHSLGTKVPSDLEEPSLVLRGAGAYQTNCFPCHGATSQRQPVVPQHMTPHPPLLPGRIPQWDDEELFYIVKHGIKFTGMPAWPAMEREDEVWDMVAFLKTLPHLDEEGYRLLVQGDNLPLAPGGELEQLTVPEGPARTALQTCVRCHGIDGTGRGDGAFPILSGQSPLYLENSLQAYARDERHSGVMQPIASGMDPEIMRALVAYYAGQTTAAPQTVEPEDAEAIERGKRIAHEGIPEQRVPSCMDCHGPAGSRRKEAYPYLGGQYADYMVLQLQLFKKEHRGGSPYAHLMHHVAGNLKLEQMRDVALYYQSLGVPLGGS